MRRLLMLAALGIFTLAVGACGGNFPMNRAVEGSGNVVERTEAFEGVHGVGISIPGEAVITIGTDEGLTIEGEDNILDNIRIRVRDGVLEITSADGVNLRPTEPIRVDVTVGTLESLACSGTADVAVGPVDVETLNVAVSGSGDVDLERLTCEIFSVAISGSGAVVARDGRADTQKVAISGSGHYDGGGLDSTVSSVAVSGSGSADVHVTGSLEAAVSGSGSIDYSGDPGTVNRKVSGTGRISATSLGI